LPIERKAIFDIYCKSVTGEDFIVEMQKAKLNFFKDRALFYSTFPIRDQSKKGEWDFKLNAIYYVAILDFIYDENKEKQKMFRDVSLKDQYGDLFYDKLHLKFLQMPLFNKQKHELENRSDKWLYFLKNLDSFDHIPSILKEPIFEKAFSTLEEANLTREQLEQYQKSLLTYWELKGVVDTAHDDGEKIGFKKGIIKGEQLGLEKGKAEGKFEEKLEVAYKLKQEGFSIEMIEKITGLSVEEIRLLK